MSEFGLPAWGDMPHSYRRVQAVIGKPRQNSLRHISKSVQIQERNRTTMAKRGRLVTTGLAVQLSTFTIGCLAFAGVGCRSGSSAAKADSGDSIREGTKASTVSPQTQRELLYGRSQNGPQTLGWLIRLGPGQSGTFFAGDRPIKICSVTKSDSVLAFATALYFDRSFRFTGKVTQGVAVGTLNSIGPGSQTREFGIARLVALDTRSISERFLDRHTGFYSDLFVHPQSGDVLGIEVFLFVAGGERVLLFQQAEGASSFLDPGLDLMPLADTLSFSVGPPPNPRHLSLVFRGDSILFRDPEAVGHPGDGTELLPREYSVEQFFDQSAKGECPRKEPGTLP
jgi:hypothetical protein